MTAMLAGSSHGSPFNFKFNRILVPTFFLNSWQQDYAQPNINLGWLESCGAYNTTSPVFPKPFVVIEVVRDVLITGAYAQTGNVAKIAWMENDTLTLGTWGQSQMDSLSGLQNPGPGAVYTNPLGLTSMPTNPITCIQDSFGNIWIVTGYGTCGNTNPFLTNLNPVFPTPLAPATVATTATDGTVTWTAVNPKGQGFRINPMPSQTGPVWQVAPIGQAKIARFTNLGQPLEPIPDDFFTYFQNGFFAQCYRRSPDPRVRAKFQFEWSLFMKSLDDAVRQGSRERDDWGFVPTSAGVMDTGYGWSNPVSPAWPYGGFY